MISCLKPLQYTPKNEPDEELKESFINLFHNLYTYLFECSRNTLDKIDNSEICWNNTDENTVESKHHWPANNNKNHKTNQQKTSKTRTEFEEGIQNVAKATQDLTKECCRHMKDNVSKLNKQLERAIEDNRRANAK